MFIVVSTVTPTKGDLVIDPGDESMVGDGDAVGVATQITQCILWTSEGAFGVEVPVLPRRPVTAWPPAGVLR